MSGDGQSSGRAGLEAQRRAIAAACTRQRWQLLELVEEIGRTAEDAKRPGIAEPLASGLSERPSQIGSTTSLSPGLNSMSW